ncbi:MAG: prolyl oligopeptidase family serine peptidase [Clostridia bacterium]|nr:prolyl oligopeptidase family serine peptidase [Clostridia bacterium]
MQEILVPSSIDQTLQPSLFYRAEGTKKRPLLVGLHTWSHDRFNQEKTMLPYAKRLNWNLLLPEFRGSNLPTNPNHKDACGSLLARQDILDAIRYVEKEENIDSENIFLLGASGGGHMTLMMCGFCPMVFKAAGAFVPITDLAAWAGENPNYRPHIYACCTEDRDALANRSPMSYIDTIAKANLKIFHGKYDPVVPVAQSLRLYSALMDTHPNSRVFLDIFDGRHEMRMHMAMHWLLSQYKKAEESTVTG